MVQKLLENLEIMKDFATPKKGLSGLKILVDEVQDGLMIKGMYGFQQALVARHMADLTGMCKILAAGTSTCTPVAHGANGFMGSKKCRS